MSEKKSEVKNQTRSNDPGKNSNESSNLQKFSFRVGAIVFGAVLFGPIGAVGATGLVAADAISNGKLTQGAGKILGAGYDVLSWVGNKVLEAGKWTIERMKDQDPERKTTDAREQEKEKTEKHPRIQEEKQVSESQVESPAGKARDVSFTERLQRQNEEKNNNQQRGI